LVVYCFTSRSRIFHLYGDVTITGEGLQNLGLCSALRAFEQGGIFIVPHCCDTGPRFFRSHPKDRPILSPLTTHKGMWKIYSYPDPHGSPFSRLLRHTRGCGGPILTRIHTGSNNQSINPGLVGRDRTISSRIIELGILDQDHERKTPIGFQGQRSRSYHYLVEKPCRLKCKL
jgi:hypothetical protein